MRSENIKLATIFFLPLEDRPKEYPLLKNFKGKFWHTGIILEGKKKIYECFNKGKNNISNLDKLKSSGYKNTVFIKNIAINEDKLVSEIESGTDCAEYVARCAGLSELKGKNKGNLYPEDIYNIFADN